MVHCRRLIVVLLIAGILQILPVQAIGEGNAENGTDAERSGFNLNDIEISINGLPIDDVIGAVDQGLASVISKIEVLVLSEIEENSFQTLALMWEDLPMITTEESTVRRAARNSKVGYVKMVVNFMVSQRLLLEAQERYYPTERFRALIENYYTEHQGRLYELLNGKEEA